MKHFHQNYFTLRTISGKIAHTQRKMQKKKFSPFLAIELTVACKPLELVGKKIGLFQKRNVENLLTGGRGKRFVQAS